MSRINKGDIVYLPGALVTWGEACGSFEVMELFVDSYGRELLNLGRSGKVVICGIPEGRVALEIKGSRGAE